jgi:hypothetical protein
LPTSHPCRHLESSFHPLLSLAEPSGLLPPTLQRQLSEVQTFPCHLKRQNGRQWNIIQPPKGEQD